MKNTISIFVTLLFFWLPAHGSAEQFTVHVEWDYNSQTQLELAGYNIYFNNAFVCLINDPAATVAECEVTAESSAGEITISAMFIDGSESSPSSSFPVTFPAPITADINATFSEGSMPLPVTFDASNSSSAAGNIVSYQWTMDGAIYSGTTVNHIFTDIGDYPIQLQVTDDSNNTAQTTTTIQVTDDTVPTLIDTALINFQPLDSEIPADALADNGSAYTTDTGYGWLVNAPSNGATRDRNNPISPDQAYDTMIHVAPSAVWEMSLPNGSYEITVCAGDASWPSGTPAVQVEGISLIADEALSSANKWIEKTLQVEVNDGKLTLAFTNSSPLTRLSWLQINSTNQPPTASIQSGSSSGVAPVTISFDGSSSTDTDGLITNYTWSINGDTLSGSSLEYSFQNSGTFSIALTVTDDMGAESQATTQVVITSPREPSTSTTINFQPSDADIPSGALADSGTIFSIDSGYGWTVSAPSNSATRDRNNPISPDQTYDTMVHVAPTAVWEMNLPNSTYEITICTGDASWPSGTPTVQVEGNSVIANTPLSTENRWITKTVQTDITDGKLTLSFTNSAPLTRLCWITVKDTSQTPPVALSAAVSSSTSTGAAPLYVEFDSSGSTGNIISYAWSFGDGGSAAGATANHTFIAQGTYITSLTITDADGKTANKATTITVLALPPPINQSPTVVLSTSTAAGPGPLAVLFDGSGSNDPDGSIATWAWDFGDGSVASGPISNHTYTIAGTYYAELKVTDNLGATDEISTPIVVTQSAPENIVPTAVIASIPQEVTAPVSVTFNGDASTDPDGTISSFKWNFGDGATGTGSVVTHTYTFPANFTVALKVTDNSGDSSSSSKNISVIEGTPAEFLLEVVEITVNNNWQSASFSQPFVNPIIVASPLSSNDDAPATIRIRNVTPDSFEIRIEDWNYLDNVHPDELVAYLAVEKGTHTLADGTSIEAGIIQGKTTATPYSFQSTFNAPPVVITSIATTNEPDTTIGKVQEITTTGFNYWLQEQESNPISHSPETVHFIAWEQGSSMVEGLNFEVGMTDATVTDTWHTIPFSLQGATAPILLGAMQTSNDSDTANVRLTSLTNKSVNIQIDEEQSADDETVHAAEVVGYLILHPGDAIEPAPAINQKINFQPANSEIPSDSLADSGLSFDDIPGYGWVSPPASGGTRDRDNPISVDQSYDTMIHVSETALWEMAIPNGTYNVTICAGDASWPSGTPAVQVEGNSLLSDEPLSSSLKWIEKTTQVVVNDGRLSVTFAGSEPLTRLCWLNIQSIDSELSEPPQPPPPATSVAINFQPENAPLHKSFLPDHGLAYSSESIYGWTAAAPSNSATRDRNNSISPDQAYDTMIHVSPTATWEIELPDGDYNVTICVGDASWPSGTPAVQVEGETVIADQPLSSTTKWIEKTIQVNVTDGKLTVTFSNSDPISRLCWISIESL